MWTRRDREGSVIVVGLPRLAIVRAGLLAGLGLVLVGLSIFGAQGLPAPMPVVLLAALTPVLAGMRTLRLGVDLDGETLIVRNLIRTYRMACRDVERIHRDQVAFDWRVEELALAGGDRRVRIQATRTPTARAVVRLPAVSYFVTRAVADEIARHIGEVVARVNQTEAATPPSHDVDRDIWPSTS
jgi:hypothetical protein